MRREHARVSGRRIHFDFTAKSGVRRMISVSDPEVASVLRRLSRRPDGGEELLVGRVADRWKSVRSTDINAYIKQHAGDEFSAKDFRTWHATVLAAVLLAQHDGASSPTGRRRVVAAVTNDVASELGNTPAVCRSSYIDPRIVDRSRERITIDLPGNSTDGDDTMRQGIEQRVLDLLRGPGSSADKAA